MSDNQQVATIQPRSIILDMATRYGMERAPFEATLRKTVMPESTSNEQLAAFLLVAKEYDLSPFTKEIFAFPKPGGGIQPVVSVDGWLKIINIHPKFDGMEFQDTMGADGKLESVTCKMYRKDRSHPTEVTEYMSECRRDTTTWKQWPARMLRHKATIQAARYAFGFSGIVDPDEMERFIDVAESSVIDRAIRIDPEPVDNDRVISVANSLKDIIDKDDQEGNWKEIQDVYSILSNNEKMAVDRLLGEKAPDSNKKYKNILKDYLAYVPAEGVQQ